MPNMQSVLTGAHLFIHAQCLYEPIINTLRQSNHRLFISMLNTDAQRKREEH